MDPADGMFLGMVGINVWSFIGLNGAALLGAFVAAISGSLLPSILRHMQIDPAIAGGVVLTTITDVTGFFVFLGLATLVYA